MFSSVLDWLSYFSSNGINTISVRVSADRLGIGELAGMLLGDGGDTIGRVRVSLQASFQDSGGFGNPPTPLHDLRVVEISDRIAGSYCGKLLLDAGAQVRKIEPPQGDWLRRYSATCSPVPDDQASPFYSYLSAGKR